MTSDAVDQVAVLAHLTLMLLEACAVTLERSSPTSDLWVMQRLHSNGEIIKCQVHQDPRKDPEVRARALRDALLSLGKTTSDIESEVRHEWERAEKELVVMREEIARLQEQVDDLRRSPAP